MKHEVIYYDNSIDKEGHEGCILYRPNWCNLSAFLPGGGVYGGAQTQFCISTLT